MASSSFAGADLLETPRQEGWQQQRQEEMESRKRQLAADESRFRAERVEDKAGVQPEFPSPFTLFVRTHDLEPPRVGEEEWQVPIIAYSLGADKAIFWGWYRPKTRTFSEEGECDPLRGTAVSRAIPVWMHNGFGFASSVVKNRVKDAWAAAMGWEQPLTGEEYIRLKLQLALLRDEIGEDEFEEALGESALEDLNAGLARALDRRSEAEADDLELALMERAAAQEYENALARTVAQYEDKMNLSGGDTGALFAGTGRRDRAAVSASNVLANLREDFYAHLLSHGWGRSRRFLGLRACPSPEACLHGMEDGAAHDDELCGLFEFGSDPDVL